MFSFFQASSEVTMNPFRPPQFAVAEFLQRLADGGTLLKDMASARKMISETVLEDNDLYAKMPLPPCHITNTAIVSRNGTNLLRCHFYLPNVTTENLSMFCRRETRPPVNPFHCSPAVLAEFVQKYFVNSRFASGAKHVIPLLNRYQK
jgi:hypothetical protein